MVVNFESPKEKNLVVNLERQMRTLPCLVQSAMRLGLGNKTAGVDAWRVISREQLEEQEDGPRSVILIV